MAWKIYTMAWKNYHERRCHRAWVKQISTFHKINVYFFNWFINFLSFAMKCCLLILIRSSIWHAYFLSHNRPALLRSPWTAYIIRFFCVQSIVPKRAKENVVTYDFFKEFTMFYRAIPFPLLWLIFFRTFDQYNCFTLDSYTQFFDCDELTRFRICKKLIPTFATLVQNQFA